VKDQEAPQSDQDVERLIARMQHGIDTCPFPAGGCTYCDRDAGCIALLRELLAFRRKASGFADAA
jgi:hypothetical protein